MRRSFKSSVNSDLYVRLNQQLTKLEREIKRDTELMTTSLASAHLRETITRRYSAYAATSKALAILEERT